MQCKNRGIKIMDDIVNSLIIGLKPKQGWSRCVRCSGLRCGTEGAAQNVLLQETGPIRIDLQLRG